MIDRRMYRQCMGARLRSFAASYRETDLWIGVDPDSYDNCMEELSLQVVCQLWRELEDHIASDCFFKETLEPMEAAHDAPSIAKRMCHASTVAKVGPMAAVAGAVSEAVGEALCKYYHPSDIIVENGGDIWLNISQEISVSVFAGHSALSQKVGFKIPPRATPLGISTSSASVGPSISFGNADAVAVVSSDAAIADAYATSFCNMMVEPGDMEGVMAQAQKAKDVLGILIIMGDIMGIQGMFDLAVFN